MLLYAIAPLIARQLKISVKITAVLLIVLSGCGGKSPSGLTASDELPALSPDYSDVTIPFNIAPLNFRVMQKGTYYTAEISSDEGNKISISSRYGVIKIPAGKWKRMLLANKGKDIVFDISVRDKGGSWKKFRPVINHVAADPVDPYVYYRLLYPGYESWSELSINYRNLTDFSSGTLISNEAADDNCINCHSFNNGKTRNFMFHMRGSEGGTYIFNDEKFRKFNLKTKEMKNGAVYPRWHPSGKFLAFSSNKIIQQFHAADNKKIEVSDLESSLLIYDLEKNTISDIPLEGRAESMDTYPEWSPDGRTLYFCRAPRISDNYDYSKIRYDLWKVSFDQDGGSFGEEKLVFDAAALGKSVAFPRVSPDGMHIAITLADYGCFPIWHKEADIIILNPDDSEATKPRLNSDFADSYHSWSSNSKWLIFSSKRDDGLTARPYIACIFPDGSSGKPFIMPQKDPMFYGAYLKSFNIPEFSVFKVEISPGRLKRLSSGKATDAKWKQ